MLLKQPIQLLKQLKLGMMLKPQSLIRPLVRDLHAYVPGGQSQVDFDAVMS
jgi:hypothetical protein